MLKFYLGFSNGAIMQFNAGNGSLIKPINEEEIEKDGIQTYKYDHTKEITSMFYYYDYKQNEDDNTFILLSTSYDSLINIYNEGDPEESIYHPFPLAKKIYQTCGEDYRKHGKESY